MKVKIKIMFLILVAIALGITTKSNAGLEAKGGGTVWKNITVSESYEQCYNLRNADSTLGTNSLDPQLILNKDWGAVSYLAASSYGAVTSYTGPSITIDGTSYYTTNGNLTGVMNLGYSNTQTSRLIEGYDETNTNTLKLVNNVDTKYVEIIDENRTIDGTKGQALAETWGWWYANAINKWPDNAAWTDYSASNRVLIRSYYFKVNNGYYYGYGNGGASDVTFRPVIWN